MAILNLSRIFGKTLIPNLNKASVRNAFLKPHTHGGNPADSVPFGKSIGNPNRMTLLCCLFFGSGLAAPCFLFIYSMHR
ncbi:unnamed protein product [Phyllotreta striolata]|uniref:Cytochrome c oxidase polypeptide VIIc n=1 Tax=Phyllotreta striolata TaxID=444603 RepID=A0A9N9XSB8_PHYSR|nr:unnamed protein product [Phyllotreta striolata]